MSARDLTVRQMGRVVRESRGEPEDPPDLGPDEMRLYSYYAPGLVAGDYEIRASQAIDTSSEYGHQQLTVKNAIVTGTTATESLQKFEVIVPRFSLDPSLINSYYPPDGHQDEGRILPHVVLNDPHYPWEILAGQSPNLRGPIDDYAAKDKSGKEIILKRNLVPWIALIVFDPEELHLAELSDLQALKLDGFNIASDVNKQDPKGVFSMKVKDYLDPNKLPPSSRINYKAGFPSHKEGDTEDTFGGMLADESSANIIFPKKQLFEALFASDADSTNSKPRIEAQRYLAHVRHINTVGFPDAGVEENGLFSIVISSRTGKLDITRPHTQICHLVSIENVDSTLGSWIHPQGQNAEPSDRIGMISLFSWIYTALPPNPVNFVDTMRNLVTNQQTLRLDMKLSKNVDTTTPFAKSLVARLSQGYTFARWRTQSGEETTAFNRGPLVPGPVPSPISADIADCSNTSQEYQILDPETGTLDLTYSSAWQLGKLMAISDTSFSSALMRFRSLVYNSSVHQTQLDISPMQTKTESLKAVLSLVSDMQSLSTGSTGDPQRFRTPTVRAPAPSLQEPEIQPLLQANVANSIHANACAGITTDSKTGRNVGKEIYNEFNLDRGNNTDWAIIHAWICEKLSLGGILPQYLLPEPAYLPPESLRFFHIDDFWLDCFLDGALSVANHLDADDDKIRRDIKRTFNLYLDQPVPSAGYKPQIPCYGFIIRSKLIKAMPDLRITLKWKDILDPVTKKIIPDKRAAACRWTKWDDETLMCLLDRQPEELESSGIGTGDFGITLAQPPHQQRFSLGSYVRKGDTLSKTSNLVEFDLRRLYTTDVHPIEWPEKPLSEAIKKRLTSWLNFDTRVLNTAILALDLKNELQFKSDDGTAYTDTCPNPCMVALELNDPSYYFRIIPPVSQQQPVPRRRQLYVKSADQVSADDALQKYLDGLKSAPLGPVPIPSSPPATKPGQPSSGGTKPTTPAPIQKPSSTETSIRPVPNVRLGSSWQPGNGSLTARSVFTLQSIYPDYKDPPAPRVGDKFVGTDYVPSANRYFFDLIFNITRRNPSDQQLLRIDIDIPMRFPGHDDPKTKSTRQEALVESTYYGSGVRMLSNQYFIPFLYFYEPSANKTNVNGLMHIELVPRSGKDGYTIACNDARTATLSFLLASVPISPLEIQTAGLTIDGQQNGTRGKVIVTMTEWYKTSAYQGGEPAPQRGQLYPVIKTGKSVIDDKDL